MVHCSECETTLSEQSDVEFIEMDSKKGIFKASKRFYLVACNNCGAAIGSGVAGAKA
jgi:predicted nucleic-acid-binding Zn-ribbon protein